MRTTIDIPDSDHALFRALAAQRGVTLGEIMVELAKSALKPSVREPVAEYRIETNPETGLPVLRGGKRVVTTEEVKKFLDETE